MKSITFCCPDKFIEQIDRLRVEMGDCSRACITRMALQYYLEHTESVKKEEEK